MRKKEKKSPILNNPNFKGVEFDHFTKQARLNQFNMTPKKWVDATNNTIRIFESLGKYLQSRF